MGQGRSKRVLVVEDDSRLRASLARGLTFREYEVLACSSVEDGIAALATFRPDVLLIDVVLPDGDALEIVAAARELGLNVPAVAVSGQATPMQSFQLAQLGFSAYLPKPIELGTVVSTLEAALSAPPNLEPLARRSVGVRAMRAIESELRIAMVDEALQRAGGNRQHAANLLDVSRQFLQHVLRKRS